MATQEGPGAVATVTIVVPAYNADRFLRATLSSVATQTDDVWRCIVVDDGSTDGTAEVARQFVEADSRFSLVEQRNKGVAAARNRGFDLSSGEYVLFLDSDDVLDSQAIEHLKLALAKSFAAAVHGLAVVVNSNGVSSPLRGHEQTHGRVRVAPRQFAYAAVPRVEVVDDTTPTEIDALLLRNPITTPGQVLIRRKALEGAGGFQTHLEPVEDWAMWMKLAQIGSLEYLPRVVIQYRKHNAGASSNLSKLRSAELLARHEVIRLSRGVARCSDNNEAQAMDLETVARLSLRRMEWERAGQRAMSAARQLASGDLREAGRDVLRTASSLRQIWLSIFGLRVRRERETDRT